MQCQAGHSELQQDCCYCGFTQLYESYRQEWLGPATVEPQERHLVYHVYPVADNEMWKCNLSELTKRQEVFTGKRALGIAVGGRTVDYRDVLEYSERLGFQWTSVNVVKNSRQWELATWYDTWRRVIDESGVTLRAHAKAVMHPFEQAEQRWAQVMYEVLLDHVDLVDAHLAQSPVTGAFKTHHGEMNDWYYAGSFYWVRNDAARRKVWQIDEHRYGVEWWPRLHWMWQEARCLFYECPGVCMDELKYWAWFIEPEYERWKQERSSSCTTGQSTSPRASIMSPMPLST